MSYFNEVMEMKIILQLEMLNSYTKNNVKYVLEYKECIIQAEG